MGYMRHHGFLVTSDKEGAIEKAHGKACVIFPVGQVSPILSTGINQIRSFAIFPDGSKEGWQESDDGDESRKKFALYLSQTKCEDGTGPLKWVEVQYGDDGGVNKIQRASGGG